MLATPNALHYAARGGTFGLTANPGTSVPPGTLNSWGAWVTLLTASFGPLRGDLDVIVHTSAVGGVDRGMVVDFGIDPAGGSSFTTVLSKLICGHSAVATKGGRRYRFPLFLPSGASLGARAMTNDISVGNNVVGVNFLLYPRSPYACRVPTFAESIGLTAGVLGTTVVPGTLSSFGSWTSLGTTTRRLSHWTAAADFATLTWTLGILTFELAYGDGSNKISLGIHQMISLGVNEEAVVIPVVGEQADVPAGATLYTRASWTGGGAPANLHIAAYGFGGG